MMWTLMKLFFKHHVRYIGQLIMGLFNALLRAIILIFFAQAFTSSTVAGAFGLTAMILLSFVGQALWEAGFFFRQQEYYGTFYRIFATPANRVLILLAFSFTSFILNVVEVLITVGVGRILGIHIVPGPMFWISALAAWFSVYGFALLISPIGIAVKNISGPIINLTQTIIYLLTGVFFPVQILPHTLQTLAYMLPFTKAFEAFRGAAVYHRSSTKILEYSLYGYLWGAIFLAIGYIAIMLSERRAMKYGYERL